MNDENSSHSDSWKKIQQQLSGPAITDTAQRRRRFVLQKRILTILAIVSLAGGLVGSAYYLSTHSKTFAPYAQEQGRTKIVFFSDGQLTQNWFEDHFSALKTKGLLSIDIAGLQAALLRNPQIMTAAVERHFPNTLKVTLRERLPIGRIKLKLSGQTATYYVARDGMLFTSALYRSSATLPYFSGASIRQGESGLTPLMGIATLSEILEGLKNNFPDLSIQLSLIDLTDWTFPITAQTSVCLQLRSGTKLRFSPEGIPTQLDRLKETLNLMTVEKQTIGGKLIDLTYPDKVAIVGTDKVPAKKGAK